ncbi:hypothetical protein B0J18DRAFT_282970 [Chaetomium sp. MPI-SDFR-AT-0129]|nr:hypothetical protein B0J18DRAFT_282970 [Chaetomium sp. MPI-SDFR-AT-0129]
MFPPHPKHHHPWSHLRQTLFLLLASSSPTIHASQQPRDLPTRDWTRSSWTVHHHHHHPTCPLPTDASPWSLPPLCPEPVGDAGGDDDDHENTWTPPTKATTDCVFTALHFRGGQGFSLITTPEIAASVAGSGALDDGDVAGVLRGQLAAYRTAGAAATDNTSRGDSNLAWTPAYEIRDIPGRDKGMIAASALNGHEIIMTGFPVLVIRMDFVNGEVFSEGQKRSMMDVGLRRLGEEQWAAVMGLAKMSGDENVVLDVLQTNGFGVEIGGVPHLALFIDGSRVNHDCHPNAFWRFNGNKMAMEIVSLRPIQPGEEVTHSYAPLGYPHSDRQTILQPWGFTCTCDLCTAPEEVRSLSDTRRSRLIDIHHTLGQAADLGDGESQEKCEKRIGELVLEAFSLIEQEDLYPQLVEYYERFARAYLMVGDVKRGRAFAEETERMWLLFGGGEEHEYVDGMKALWAAVKEAEEEQDEE